MEEAGIFRTQIASLHDELSQHRQILTKISDNMTLVAQQSVQIANINRLQIEHHTDIENLQKSFSTITNWQASCPRKQIGTLWGVVISIVLIGAAAFINHLISVAPKVGG